MPGIAECKCVLVIGATSGIGRALALAIHALPSKPTVIVAGRRQDRLDELEKKDERLETAKIDVNSGRGALKSFVHDLTAKYPDLDAVMFSSGIQHMFDFTKPENIDFDLLETELNTNYTSITKMIAFFLPHFLKLSVNVHLDSQLCLCSVRFCRLKGDHPPLLPSLRASPSSLVPGSQTTVPPKLHYTASPSLLLFN
ncbi:hypothetical protein AcV5_004689 [Taiwanofungus camphoratus]|nr:hypothetical protein AcW2_000709 [Antrodia cinnamomea]KAI0936593.1 hypothetical protein AcV5_004689 [Antrodia cinnamomea]